MKSTHASELLQAEHNAALLKETPFCGAEFTSQTLPFRLDLSRPTLNAAEIDTIHALQKESANIAIKSLISLAATTGDIDHLGGALDLIPALTMTLGIVDYDSKHFTIEHAHTSIGYYATLAALGFIDEKRVIEGFRRGLDIAGHVSWVPGGTQLNGGRLGVMIPAAVGQALGTKARKGKEALVICHTGDAGWISGQALNGFLTADLLKAPVVFVMHRNGIQLSGPTAKMMAKDPRSTIAGLGIEIIETPSLADTAATYAAYHSAIARAAEGKPCLIYPVGYRSTTSKKVTLAVFGEMYGVTHETAQFAEKNKVALSTEIWIPGSLMSYRDVHAMLECLFLVNNLPGGEGHHDGGMKGKDGAAVLKNPMLQLSSTENKALDSLRSAPKRAVITRARPKVGSPNLPLTAAETSAIELPTPADKWVSPRAGSEAAYAAVAKKYPQSCFFVSCDLDPSTKLGKAAKLVPPSNRFEVSIQEQIATIMANGLACSSYEPQLNAVATFSAFFEGIAREGFEMWRYQRNLTGVNEGLNVIMHLSHVGVCTGRDHFSGWSMDWASLAIGYLPYLHRAYAPADARAAFLAVKDAAAHYGGHIVCVPRDNLPILEKQGSTTPLWTTGDSWEPVTSYRCHSGAKIVILALGAPSYLAGQAADILTQQGSACDAYVINGLPLPTDFLASIGSRYETVVTIEDGIIGDSASGLRGFAALAASGLADSGCKLRHCGITDPRVAPSEHFSKLWEYFGITKENLVRVAKEGYTVRKKS